jgi:hypothetical protein
MTDTTEALGTFACPICGQATPHSHPPQQVAAYQDDQVRNDGWISMAHKMPRPVGWSGFYLIRGHRLDVPQPDYNNVSYNAYQRRDERDGFPAEVAEWEGSKFMLLHWSGNARIDGTEGRSPVFVNPTHWRELPPFGVVRPAGVEVGINGLTEAETSATASVTGIVGDGVSVPDGEPKVPTATDGST